MCNRKCFECKFNDCLCETVDELEAYKAHLRDKEAKCGAEITRVYKYNHSEKRKAVSARYLATEKGKETRRKSTKKYAEMHPDRVRAKSRLYYERHKEEIKARRIRKELKNETIREESIN